MTWDRIAVRTALVTAAIFACCGLAGCSFDVRISISMDSVLASLY